MLVNIIFLLKTKKSTFACIGDNIYHLYQLFILGAAHAGPICNTRGRKRQRYRF